MKTWMGRHIQSACWVGSSRFRFRLLQSPMCLRPSRLRTGCTKSQRLCPGASSSYPLWSWTIISTASCHPVPGIGRLQRIRLSLPFALAVGQSRGREIPMDHGSEPAVACGGPSSLRSLQRLRSAKPSKDSAKPRALGANLCLQV